MQLDGQILSWAIQGAIVAICTYGVRVLSDLTGSIKELNIKLAIVVEKVSGHEKELERHNGRIERLERDEE